MCLPITHLSSPMGHHRAIYLYMCVLVRTWEFVFWWTPSTRIMSCRCYQPLVVFEPALTCWALRSFAQLVFVQGVQGIVAFKEPCRNQPLPAHPTQAPKNEKQTMNWMRSLASARSPAVVLFLLWIGQSRMCRRFVRSWKSVSPKRQSGSVCMSCLLCRLILQKRPTKQSRTSKRHGMRNDVGLLATLQGCTKQARQCPGSMRVATSHYQMLA